MGVSAYPVPSFSGHSTEPALQVPSGNSWTKLWRTIGEVDERKVKDCKEDIDTILVFAGLFSAIMTAFLVQTYQSLQQNPMDTVVFLLRQIVAQRSDSGMDQNPIVSGHLSNPQASEFQPTLNAKRVNLLWFVSLILSLVSASFGIVVKQWLREYIAGEDTSAQALLRIRHFRHPGLVQYRIFEIAAMLPLLLQLSLALFLIGLCFFTADVHSSIGHTTLPLVAAWGFLFLAASSVPLWDPACPYKTPFLKALFNAARKHLFKGVIYDEQRAKTNDSSDVDVLLEIDARQVDDQLLKSTLWEALQQANPPPGERAEFLFKVLSHRMNSKNDVSSMLRDSKFLNLKGLLRDTCITIMDMIADLVSHEIAQLRVPPDDFQSVSDSEIQQDSDQWLKDNIRVLLSYTEVPHSTKCNEVLRLCLSNGRYRAVSHIIHTSIDMEAEIHIFLSVMQRLKGGLALITDPNELIAILGGLLYRQGCPTPLPRLQMVRGDMVQFIPSVRHHNMALLRQILSQQFLLPWAEEAEGTGHWTLVDRILFQELIKVSGLAPTKLREKIVALVKRLLLSEQVSTSEVICEIALSNNKIWSEVRNTAQQVIVDAVMLSDVPERSKILIRFAYIYGRQESSQDITPDTIRAHKISLDPLHGCYLHLRLIQRVFDSGGRFVPDQGITWKSIFDSLVPSLHSYPPTRDDPIETSKAAIKCLELIHNLEEQLHSSFQTDNSSNYWPLTPPSSLPFDEKLRQTLFSFVQNQPNLHWRLQRVMRLQHESLTRTSEATRASQGQQQRGISSAPTPPSSSFAPLSPPLSLSPPPSSTLFSPRFPGTARVAELTTLQPPYTASPIAHFNRFTSPEPLSIRTAVYDPPYVSITPRISFLGLPELDVELEHSTGSEELQDGGDTTSSSSRSTEGVSREMNSARVSLHQMDLQESSISMFLNSDKPHFHEYGVIDQGNNDLDDDPNVSGHPLGISGRESGATVMHRDVLPTSQHSFTPTPQATPSRYPLFPKQVPSELTQGVLDWKIPRFNETVATFVPTIPDWSPHPINEYRLPPPLSQDPAFTSQDSSHQQSPEHKEHSTDEGHNDDQLTLLRRVSQRSGQNDKVLNDEGVESPAIFRVMHGRDKGRTLHSSMKKASSIDTDGKHKHNIRFEVPWTDAEDSSRSPDVPVVWSEEPSQIEEQHRFEGQDVDPTRSISEGGTSGSDGDTQHRSSYAQVDINLHDEWRTVPQRRRIVV